MHIQLVGRLDVPKVKLKGYAPIRQICDAHVARNTLANVLVPVSFII